MNRYLRPFLISFVVFLLGFAWSYFYYTQLTTEQFGHAQNELDLRKEKVISHIKDKLKLYEYGLRGMRGAILHEKDVKRKTVQTYINSRNLDDEFPGSLGYGYISRTKRSEFNILGKFLSKEYQSPIKIWSKDRPLNAEFGYIINYIEPTGTNKVAIGLDITTEINRFEAAEESMNTESGVITKRINLVQDHKNLPGFLYLLPVYDKQQSYPNVEERRKHLRGWAYTAIVLKNVLDELMRSYDNEVAIEVYTSEYMTNENLIYASPESSFNDPNSLSMEGQFKIGGKIWSYYMVTLPKFQREFLSNLPFNYFLISTTISLLISTIIFILQVMIIKAREIAEEMTKSYKEALKVKTEFLATMSHEIRTPLNGILGLTDLLIDNSIDHKNLDYLQNIRSAGNTLKVVIDDILDFSKIESGNLKLELRVFDVKKMCNELHMLYLKMAEDKKINFTIKIDESIPSYIVGDEFRLRQILSNLLSNAVKFTTSGEINFNIKNARNAFNQVEVSFQIRDSGIGMDQETMSKLFHKFTQADSSISRRFGGTGLGLAISKMLVDKMNGEILVDSKMGSGSSFTVNLNFEISENKIDEIKNENYKFETNLKILIVEDNEINIKVIVKLLEKYFIDVDIAYNGLDAIEKVKQKTYDLILMDCQMPIMDGLKATEEIRKIEKRHQVIIALTANVTLEDQDICKNAGMDDFLAKPINRAQLFSKLEKIKKIN